MNKKNLLYLVLVLMLFGFQSDKPVITKWVITSGCSLQVNGSTNINKFSCVISSYNRPDTIITSRIAGQPVKLSGNIQLDVQQFDCHNAIMTADLRKTLKSKEHPKLMIFFASMNQYPEPGKWGLKGSVLIVLAGVSRNYDVDYRLVSTEPGMITLEGTRKVNFSDFNLTPPRKLGGMIKTNNELVVVFTLRMRVLPS
ncbi:MAG TPA: hypothetical protein VF145_04620 [Chitinophagaceae bacterium]